MGQVSFELSNEFVGNHIKVVHKVYEESKVDVLKLEFEEGKLYNDERGIEFEDWREFVKFCELNEECFLVVEVRERDRYEFFDWCNYQVFCEDGRELSEGDNWKDSWGERIWLFTLQCDIDD